MQPYVIIGGNDCSWNFPLLVSGCFIELRAGRGNLKSRLIEESTKLSKTLETSLHACDATTELKKRNLCPQAILLITLLTRHFRFVACCGLVFFVLMINFKVLLRWPCQQFLIKLWWHQCVLDRRLFSVLTSSFN